MRRSSLAVSTRLAAGQHFLLLQADDTDDDLGAPAIEIGFELAAPRQEPTNMPVGPDVEASAASPNIVEQKGSRLQRKRVAQGQFRRRPTILTGLFPPDNLNKPKERMIPKTAQAVAIASTESIAVEATATPTSQTIQEAARSTAPALGSGESRRRARVDMGKELMATFRQTLALSSRS